MEAMRHGNSSLRVWSKPGGRDGDGETPAQVALRSTFHDLSDQQLQIYAKELQEHYHEERRLRQKLEEWNGQLQQMLVEMTAMSKFMQERLAQSFSMAYAYRGLMGELEQIQMRAYGLLQGASTESEPEMQQLYADISAIVTRLRAIPQGNPTAG